MKIINADCIQAMKEMAENSIDAIVTDPPYELGFMGKSWDSTGIAFNVEVWQQALRVLKPGGHLIAFSGSRTYHRMAVAIEDAGFEIRDQIMWVYGSGFPKSHNIAKGIDKATGFQGEVIGTEKIDIGMQGGSMHAGRETNVVERQVLELSNEAKQWEGWGTALKPAHEPMVLARKPLEGTVANNVLTFGVGGLNIDGSRVATNDAFGGGAKGTSGFAAGYDADGWVAGSDKGRFPANFIHDGSDEVVALFPDTKPSKQSLMGAGGIPNGANNLVGSDVERNQDFESVRGFNDSGSAARFFYCAKASKHDRNEGLDGFEQVRTGAMQATADGSMLTGSGNERTTTRANHHPTVKPTDLMRYLCKLVTPPKGIVLDPFMGSGSTGKGAVLEGFEFIGIEQSAEYCEIAKARIDYVQNNLPEFAQEFLL
jgi:site-specific DNA-methyltransferase (adenine-specific)